MNTGKGKPVKAGSQTRSALAPGERVVIAASWHSDVASGQVGTVRDRAARGYWVEVTTFFADALRPHVRSAAPATRCLFFTRRELRLLEQ